MLTKKSTVLFVTFSMWTNGQRMPTNGNLEPLRDFLVPRVSKLILIDQPHPGSDRVLPRIEEYSMANPKPALHATPWWMYTLWPFLRLTNQNRTQLIFKVRDFASVFDWALRNAIHYDYFIGMENINTLAGIILKKLGRINRVIYYVLDFSPSRYPGLLNRLYLFLDRYCATHADYIWDVSPAIHPARIKSGLDPAKSASEIHVPIGVYPHQILPGDINKMQKNALVYMGTLGKENGPDLAVEILPQVVKKFPDATLHVIGGGEPNLDRLKRLAQALGISDRVTFHGFVVESTEMAKILRSCYLALAPYRTLSGTIRQYGDSSKLRSYAASGLPIVTTSVPPLGSEMQKLGGAIIAADTKHAFSEAVISVLANPKLYSKMRQAVISYAQNNTWDNEFSHAFTQSP